MFQLNEAVRAKLVFWGPRGPVDKGLNIGANLTLVGELPVIPIVSSAAGINKTYHGDRY